MKVEMILPIASIRGMLRRDGYFFRKYNGIQLLQRCPDRSHHQPTARELAHRQRFGEIARTVAQLRRQGSCLTQKELWILASAAYDAARK